MTKKNDIAEIVNKLSGGAERCFYRPPAGSPPLLVTVSGRREPIQPPDQFWTRGKQRISLGFATDKDGRMTKREEFGDQNVWYPDPEKKGKRPPEGCLLDARVLKALFANRGGALSVRYVDSEADLANASTTKTARTSDLRQHLFLARQLDVSATESIRDIEKRHAETIADLKRTHAAEVARIEAVAREEQDKREADLAKARQKKAG